MTLIEVLIALGLTVGVLSAITWCYRTIVHLEAKANEERVQAFQEAFVQARLSSILPLAEKFYPTERGILFHYDNGIDLNNNFSNKVFARLYQDQDKFCLALMSENKETIRCEVLMEKVETLEFRYGSEWKTVPPTIHILVNNKDYPFVLPYSDIEVKR